MYIYIYIYIFMYIYMIFYFFWGAVKRFFVECINKLALILKSK